MRGALLRKQARYYINIYYKSIFASFLLLTNLLFLTYSIL